MTKTQTFNAALACINRLPHEERNQVLLALAGTYVAEQKLRGAPDVWIQQRLEEKSSEVLDAVREGTATTSEVCAA